MTKTIQFTVAAQKDIEAIYEYTLETWGAAQADHYLTMLENHINQIPKGLAAARKFNTWRDGGLVTAAGRHKVFLIENDNDFLVVRVLHESRDFLRHLPNDTQ